MTLPVQVADGGVTFAVKAVPGSSRDRIAGLHGEALKIQVAAPPERGKANERICELLAAALGVPERAIAVVAGTTSPHKRVFVRGLDAATVLARLAL